MLGTHKCSFIQSQLVTINSVFLHFASSEPSVTDELIRFLPFLNRDQSQLVLIISRCLAFLENREKFKVILENSRENREY